MWRWKRLDSDYQGFIVDINLRHGILQLTAREIDHDGKVIIPSVLPRADREGETPVTAELDTSKHLEATRSTARDALAYVTWF